MDSSLIEVYERMLYREFLAQSKLYEDLGLDRLEKALALAFDCSEQEAISNAMRGDSLEHISIERLRFLFRINDMRFRAKTPAALSRELKERKADYQEAIRCALSYAVNQLAAHAYAALRIAAYQHDNWAYHHYLMGLLRAIEGNEEGAKREFFLALEKEPYEDARARIRQAIDLIDPRSYSLPQK